MKARLLRVLGGRRGLFVGAAGFLLLVLPVTAGRPINVTAGATTPGIDFGLARGGRGGSCPVTGGMPIRVTAGGIDFGLARGGRISSTVTDAVTGQPLENTHAGNVRFYPAGAPTPQTSTVNFTPGMTRAGNAIVPLNASG